MVDYINTIVIYEKGCGSLLKEHTGQSLVWKPVRLVSNEDLLFRIFATPQPNQVNAGWKPNFRMASLALVSALEYQLQLYKNKQDLKASKLVPFRSLSRKASACSRSLAHGISTRHIRPASLIR